MLPKKGANGGMVTTSQGHPIEFVLKGQELTFYVNDDDGSPLPTKDMQGRATISGRRQDENRTTATCCSEHDGRQGGGSAWLESARRILGDFSDKGAYPHTHRTLCHIIMIFHSSLVANAPDAAPDWASRAILTGTIGASTRTARRSAGCTRT